MYVNGEYHSEGSSAPNGIGNHQLNTGSMQIYTNWPDDSDSDINGVTWIQIYDRMITEEEQKKIYDITKEKHG